MGLGFPNKLFTRLKYVEHFTLTATNGVLNTYRFCANGCYDPNITGTGHQPMYFDQYSALYDHFVVLGSKIKVKAGYTSSGNTNAQVAVAVMSNDNASHSLTDISGVTEQSQVSRSVLLDPFNTKTITKSYSAKRVYGGNILSQDNLRGSATANPTETWYYDFMYQGIGGANASITLYVEIDYYVCWTELNDIGQS